MEIPAILKNKFLLIGVAVGAVLLLYTRQSSGDSGNTPSIMGYDKELIAMGQQTALEREKLASGLEMARLQTSTELAGKRNDNETALGLMTLSTNAELQINKEQSLLSQFLAKTESDLNWHVSDNEAALNTHAINSNREVSIFTAGQQANTANYAAQQSALAQIETSRITAAGNTATAKAGKSKGISCCGFGLSF